MSMFETWLLLVLVPNLPIVFLPIALISLFAGIAGFIWAAASKEDIKEEGIVQMYRENDAWSIRDEREQNLAISRYKNGKMFAIFCTIFFFISTLVLAAIPDKKEMAAIVLIPYVSNNAEFKQIPANLASTLNDLIKEYRQKLEPK